MKSVDMHMNVLQCICLNCIQTAIANAADTAWVWKGNHGSPEIVVNGHAGYIYAALTLFLPSKPTFFFFLTYFGLKWNEEFILKDMCFIFN